MTTTVDDDHFAALEARWAPVWRELDLFTSDDNTTRPRKYLVTMFPYPSGDLHMGHAEVLAIHDVAARYWRMRGYEVLNPLGWDSFGMPAENAAIAGGTHPADYTDANITTQARSLERYGLAIDWSRRLHTHDAQYMKWTQWLFVQMLGAGLAYREHAPVNWCEQDQTVLANEQVAGGRCERCAGPVVQRDMTQWFLRTTAYADELHDGLDALRETWPAKVLGAQRAWIGRSQGAHIDFEVPGSEPVTVFTTRPDTLWGVTALALAPDNPAAAALVAPHRREAFEEYAARARSFNDIERLSTAREVTGVDLGAWAVHPLTGERLPVLACDYVLASAGTGAIMVVPSCDERDAKLARATGLEVRAVLESGRYVSSGPLNGMAEGPEAIAAAIEHLENVDAGRAATSYRLRDWLVSRQRYWGAPVPVIHCPECGPVAVPVADLPVTLPDLRGDELRPRGVSPLAAASEWGDAECPSCAGPARRDSDTLDTFVDSAWYFLRYLSPNDPDRAFDARLADAWGPVDLYVGGDEHAVLHLLYARFVTRALRDMGHLTWDEPFTSYLAQGKVLAGGQKMSKSRGNGVSLGEQLDEHGVDAVRLTMVFAGPVADDIEWSAVSPAASGRFLRRALRLADAVTSAPQVAATGDSALRRTTARALSEIAGHVEGHRYNVAVARLMELVNVVRAAVENPGTSASDLREAVEAVAQVVSLFAPYTAEEMWSRLGHEPGIAQRAWPAADPGLCEAQSVTAVIQVDGKVRGRLQVAPDISAADLEAKALACPEVIVALDGRPVARVVVREPKIVALRT